MNRISLTLALLATLALPFTTRAQTLDDAWKSLDAYKLGESRKPLREIEKAVAASISDAARRAAIAKKLAAFLSSAASIEAKDFAVHQLALCAGSAEIPALAKLLPDETLSHPARFVLENMSDPAAGAALRDALAGTKDNVRVGIITSLGIRRDAEAIPALAPLLLGSDTKAGCAAAAALARIGTLQSAQGLINIQHRSDANQAIKTACLEALPECAENLVKSGKKQEAVSEIYRPLTNPTFPARIRVAAMAGLMAAAPDQGLPITIQAIQDNDPAIASPAWGLLRSVNAPDATKTMVDAIPTLPAPAQAMMLEVLTARGDAAARPAAIAAIKSSDSTVKEAAIRALATLGSTQDLALLAPMLAKGNDNLAAAKSTLARMRDPSLDKAILDLIASSSNVDQRVTLIEILGLRLSSASTPALLKLAQADPNENIRAAATNALGAVVEDKDAPALVALLAAAKEDERDPTLKAIGLVAARMKSPDTLVPPITVALEKADAPAKAALLSALARVGGDQALGILRNAARDTNVAVKDAAVRALAQWSDVAAVPDLLAIMKGDDAKHRVLAVRGLASLVQKLPAASAADAVKICQQMLDTASRPEDKRVALSALGSLKSTAALNLAVKLLADDQLRDEAASTTIRISQLLGGNKEPAKSALQKVINSNTTEALKKRAKDVQTKGK